jgi:hypothetical protein
MLAVKDEMPSALMAGRGALLHPTEGGMMVLKAERLSPF